MIHPSFDVRVVGLGPGFIRHGFRNGGRRKTFHGSEKKEQEIPAIARSGDGLVGGRAGRKGHEVPGSRKGPISTVAQRGTGIKPLALLPSLPPPRLGWTT